MAFNTQIHNRLAVPPRWAGEGLALLFDAPGVWNPHQYRLAKDRINPARLSAVPGVHERAASRRQPAAVHPEFRAGVCCRAALAYPEAWALTFFLSETEPAKYLQYLARTAARAAQKVHGTRTAQGIHRRVRDRPEDARSPLSPLHATAVTCVPTRGEDRMGCSILADGRVRHFPPPRLPPEDLQLGWRTWAASFGHGPAIGFSGSMRTYSRHAFDGQSQLQYAQVTL